MARYYNPRLGRFMSPDPLGGSISNPQSLNRYSYVLNNPESFVDPLGLKCVRLDDGNWGDDGTLPKCNDPSVWTSETVTVNGGGGETPSELYQLLWEAEYGLQPTTPPLVYARLPFGGGPRPVGPNKPQSQAPQKKPCTPLANSLQGTPAAGFDTFLDAIHRLTSPLEMISENGFIFVGGAGAVVGGAAAITVGCADPSPFEPATCLAGVAGGAPTMAGGAALIKQGVSFFKNYTLPAIEDWGCHE